MKSVVGNSRSQDGCFPSVVILRMEKGSGFLTPENDGSFACGQNDKTGTQEKMKNGGIATARSESTF